MSCGSEWRRMHSNINRRRRRRKKRPKRTIEQIARGRKRRISLQRQPLGLLHKTKGRSRAWRPPCKVASGLAIPRATARATASEWRPYVPLVAWLLLEHNDI